MQVAKCKCQAPRRRESIGNHSRWACFLGSLRNDRFKTKIAHIASASRHDLGSSTTAKWDHLKASLAGFPAFPPRPSKTKQQQRDAKQHQTTLAKYRRARMGSAEGRSKEVARGTPIPTAGMGDSGGGGDDDDGITHLPSVAMILVKPTPPSSILEGKPSPPVGSSLNSTPWKNRPTGYQFGRRRVKPRVNSPTKLVQPTQLFPSLRPRSCSKWTVAEKKC